MTGIGLLIGFLLIGFGLGHLGEQPALGVLLGVGVWFVALGLIRAARGI